LKPSCLSHCSICRRTFRSAWRSICLTRSALRPVLLAISCNVNVCSPLDCLTMSARALSAFVLVRGIVVVVKMCQVSSTDTPRVRYNCFLLCSTWLKKSFDTLFYWICQIVATIYFNKSAELPFLMDLFDAAAEQLVNSVVHRLHS
jgi:hypothetical protein